MPDTIPAGLTTFRLVNQGKELHHASLVRLRDGKTVADFQAGLAAAMQSHTPPPSWMTFAGGPNAVTLGDTGVATETLEPGSYVFVCWIPSLDGVPHVMKGMLHPLLVTPGADAACPSSRAERRRGWESDRKSTRLNSSHQIISYAVFCLTKKR